MSDSATNAAPRGAMPASPLRIGVVGINDRIRRSILAGIARSPSARLAAVCSRDAGKAAAVAAEFGCRPATRLNELFDSDVDAVFVATPPALHCPMSLAAIAAGKHVICEKPLATSVEEATLMVETARRAGVRTAVNFTYRTGAHHRHVAAILASGALGPIVSFRLVYWQARGLLPGSPWRDALDDLGPHLFDSASWWLSLVGAGDFEQVSAVARPADPAIGLASGYAYHCQVRLTGGGIGSIEVSRAAPGYQNGLALDVAGVRGSLRMAFDSTEGSVEVAALGSGRHEGMFEHRPTPAEYAVSYQDFPERHMTRIARGILGEVDFPDFEQGLRVQRLIAAASASVRAGGWIRV